MKVQILTTLLAVVATNGHGAHHHKRQATRTTSVTGTSTAPPGNVAPAPNGAATGILALTTGGPPSPTLPLTTTYRAGATPPIAGAPVLPSPCTCFGFMRRMISEVLIRLYY